MADINDFKIIKLKSKKMFEFINCPINKNISDLSKERLGFYHLILENITGDMNFQEESCTIIDTEYNSILKNIKIDDLGIDAISILETDKGEIDIKLFNFKYRKTFNPDKTKSENDISRSTKFLEYILQNKRLKNSNLVYEKINKINDHLNSNKICNLFLYMVSNEPKGFSFHSNEYIKILEKSYGMKVVNISLDEIVSFFNERKDNKKSTFMISKDDFLLFESDDKSTQKSYILKMSLVDLIRITVDNENLSNSYSIENDEEILNSNLDYSLLYDNVRGFLGDTKYNMNIINTLKDSHRYFFMYNNGITITAENIECESKNSGMKYLFMIENFQIVNGGQTIRSIYNFLNSKDNLEKITKLREAYVLIRIFKTSKNDPLKNSIAEYTNSQNSISDVDLKSIDNIQIQIEKYLEELDILYARKAGSLGDLKKQYNCRISMEKLAQVLYSSLGYPDRASNQKRRLFQDYYDEIFKSSEFKLDKCKYNIDKFYEIEKCYKDNKKFKVSDQKIFYIIYITTITQLTIEKAIIRLEELLCSYESNVAESRKLIQKGFKQHVENNIKRNNDFENLDNNNFIV